MVCVGGVLDHGAHDAVGWVEGFSIVQPDLKQQTAGWWPEVLCVEQQNASLWQKFCVEQQKAILWQKASCGAAEGRCVAEGLVWSSRRRYGQRLIRSEIGSFR